MAERPRVPAAAADEPTSHRRPQRPSPSSDCQLPLPRSGGFPSPPTSAYSHRVPPPPPPPNPLLPPSSLPLFPCPYLSSCLPLSLSHRCISPPALSLSTCLLLLLLSSSPFFSPFLLLPPPLPPPLSSLQPPPPPPPWKAPEGSIREHAASAAPPHLKQASAASGCPRLLRSRYSSWHFFIVSGSETGSWSPMMLPRVRSLCFASDALLVWSALIRVAIRGGVALG